MKKIDIKLAVTIKRAKTLIPWSAYASCDKALAVCKAPEWRYKDGKAQWCVVTRKHWQVIHIPSGYVLPHCHDIPTSKDAQNVVSAIGDWVDWSKDPKEIYRCLKDCSTKWYWAVKNAVGTAG